MKYTAFLDNQLYKQRELNFVHEPMSNEKNLYNLIINGEPESIKSNQEKYKNHVDTGKGKLSDNPLRNQIYHLVVNVAVIARICEGNGLPREISYTLSDIYIRRADKCTTVKEVMKINDEMVISYAEEMRKLHSKLYPKPIRKAVNYIHENLHTKITTDHLASVTDCDRSYLCTLFKTHIGTSIGKYILDIRIETAKNMILSERYPLSEIALTLCFGSQSYFSKVFKQQVGTTPSDFAKNTNIL